MNNNTLLGWIYRAIDLSAVTSPIWRLPIQPSQSFGWLLRFIQCSYDSSADDPSQFDVLLWRLHINSQNRALQCNLDQKPNTPISATLNSGINDLTAGDTRPKEYFFKSPEINWPIQALEAFSFELENHTALTGVVRVLFVGEFVFKNVVLNGSNYAARG